MRSRSSSSQGLLWFWADACESGVGLTGILKHKQKTSIKWQQQQIQSLKPQSLILLIMQEHCLYCKTRVNIREKKTSMKFDQAQINSIDVQSQKNKSKQSAWPSSKKEHQVSQQKQKPRTKKISKQERKMKNYLFQKLVSVIRSSRSERNFIRTKGRRLSSTAAVQCIGQRGSSLMWYHWRSKSISRLKWRRSLKCWRRLMRYHWRPKRRRRLRHI